MTDKKMCIIYSCFECFFEQGKGSCAEIMSVTLNLLLYPVFNCVYLPKF